MSRRTLVPAVLPVALAVLGLSTILARSGQAQAKEFICAADANNIPTTYALVADGQVPVFAWTSTDFPPPWTPMRRCQEVSKRMTQQNGAGNLEYIATGYVNRQPVICAGNACRPDGSNLLYTLKPGQDPAQELEKLLAHRSGATAGPLTQSTGGGAIFSLGQYMRSAIPESTPSAVDRTGEDGIGGLDPVSPAPATPTPFPTPTW